MTTTTNTVTVDGVEVYLKGNQMAAKTSDGVEVTASYWEGLKRELEVQEAVTARRLQAAEAKARATELAKLTKTTRGRKPAKPSMETWTDEDGVVYNLYAGVRTGGSWGGYQMRQVKLMGVRRGQGYRAGRNTGYYYKFRSDPLSPWGDTAQDDIAVLAMTTQEAGQIFRLQQATKNAELACDKIRNDHGFQSTTTVDDGVIKIEAWAKATGRYNATLQSVYFPIDLGANDDGEPVFTATSIKGVIVRYDTVRSLQERLTQIVLGELGLHALKRPYGALEWYLAGDLRLAKDARHDYQQAYDAQQAFRAAALGRGAKAAAQYKAEIEQWEEAVEAWENAAYA